MLFQSWFTRPSFWRTLSACVLPHTGLVTRNSGTSAMARVPHQLRTTTGTSGASPRVSLNASSSCFFRHVSFSVSPSLRGLRKLRGGEKFLFRPSVSPPLMNILVTVLWKVGQTSVCPARSARRTNAPGGSSGVRSSSPASHPERRMQLRDVPSRALPEVHKCPDRHAPQQASWFEVVKDVDQSVHHVLFRCASHGDAHTNVRRMEVMPSGPATNGDGGRWYDGHCSS